MSVHVRVGVGVGVRHVGRWVLVWGCQVYSLTIYLGMLGVLS